MDWLPTGRLRPGSTCRSWPDASVLDMTATHQESDAEDSAGCDKSSNPRPGEFVMGLAS